ncbi:MAG: hypothetical protein KBA33_06095 [Cloacibacterium sp.]|nr:hypothetical protein [Cloacibacterium sp.]
MDKEVLEEKIELLRWIINLNDETIIRNLTNFKNELFGVPFLESNEAKPKKKYAYISPKEEAMFGENYFSFDDKYTFEFNEKFEEAFTLEQAKEQTTNKIEKWWRD